MTIFRAGNGWRPDRRSMLQLGTLGLGALATPGMAQSVLGARGFTHGVASGEPGPDSVLLWTRHVTAHGDSPLTAELSETVDFARVIGGGSGTARADNDHILKLVVSGLSPGRWYYYRFVAGDGSTSCTGRTRTLPVGPVPAFTLGVFSCANIGFGWFNAYAHAARRNDIDLAVHLGDYLYEYPVGDYPAAAERLAERTMLPAGEIVALADYRLRYVSYRADAALQQLHQSLPMIAMWDDHEFANDAWEGGAQNHDPAREGDWAARKAAARRAYHEWMPVSDAPWRSYEVGALATIALPETRVTARMEPLSIADAVRGASDVAAALAQFRDTAWQAGDRTLMGAAQERWLSDLFARSTGNGTRWQVLAQQVIMGRLHTSGAIRDWVAADAPDYVRRRTAVAALAAEAGLPLNLDAWDGYPAARSRLLRSAQAQGANLVTLSGDSHNAWAFDLTEGGTAAGVEFATHSVTSPGFEAYVPRPPAAVTDMLLGANPGLVWADTSRRGYLTVQLTEAAAQARWHLWDTVRDARAAPAADHSVTARHNERRITRV